MQLTIKVTVADVTLVDGAITPEVGYPAGYVNACVTLRVGDDDYDVQHGVVWSYDSPSVAYWESRHMPAPRV